MTELNILDIDISMTLIKEWSPVMKVVRLGRSIHYININKNILDRVRLVAWANDLSPVVNVDRLGRSICFIRRSKYLIVIDLKFHGKKVYL